MMKQILSFLSTHEALVGAIIGGLFSLLGSHCVLKHDLKRHKEERIEKIKPVLINYDYISSQEKSGLPHYIFTSEDDIECGNIEGVFKNTDNGIAFIDMVETKNKLYRPYNMATVDKDTAFVLVLKKIQGEDFKECKIHCHDILGNQYYYRARFIFSQYQKSDITLEGQIDKVISSGENWDNKNNFTSSFKRE